jgi:type II secretion system protein H
MYTTARRRSDVRLRRNTVQRGYTLLELIIVLAILGLLIAVAWPNLRRPALRSIVQEAARQIVRDVARARAAAIESGRILAWRWELDGQRYVVELAADARQRTDFDQPPAAAPKEADQPSEEPLDAVGFLGALDDDVRFVDPTELAADEPSPVGPALRQLLREDREETEAVRPRIERDADQRSLSEPVFFYPTGRAENAEIALEGPDGYRIRVLVRGLTGAATLGPLTHPTRAETDPERARLSRQARTELPAASDRAADEVLEQPTERRTPPRS